MPYQVVVIGADFGGIGMAIALKRAGIDDFVVADRADDLGGTWRDNSYPGLTCDIPSHLYSFSFRPWRWSRRFPPREEILAYLHALVAERGLGPLNHDAAWPVSGWLSSAPGPAPSSSYPRSPRPRRVYQRSAPYVLPKADRPYRDAEHALYDRLPVVRKADRVRIFLEQSAQRASEGTWSEKQTEQIILAAARVGQHVFALNVLSSCGQRCVFCGLNPSAFTPSACSWPDISSRGKTASPAGAWTAGTDSPPAQPRRHLRHGAVDRRLSLHQR